MFSCSFASNRLTSASSCAAFHLARRLVSTTTTSMSLRSPNANDFQELSKRIDKVLISHDAQTLLKYNADWTGHYQGRSKIVCQPQSTQEVASILKYCNKEKIGVVPQAGNTSVVGGSVPIQEEVILSLERLDGIVSFDDENGILTCGAGCVLQSLQEKVASYSHLMPIDLGAKGSCQIGGNVSTNAGGQYYYRFGSIHANIIGMEVVLPDGTILDLLSKIQKDNTGYDLKHLFIGAEGTLGVITKVAIKCPRLPTARNVAFLACESFDMVRKTLTCAKDELGEILAAFEFIDEQMLDQVGNRKKIPVKHGERNYPFCILLETQGSNDEHDMAKLESFVEKSITLGNVVDGTLAQDMKQVNDMWEIRESCNPIIREIGYNYKYDISLPLSDYYDIVEEMRERLVSKPEALVVNWGHVIDGNLHLNIITPGDFSADEQIIALIEPFIFESVVRRGGSISAEHGLGQSKNNYLGKYAKNDDIVKVMKLLKSIFDPNGIMNPGKFLPSTK